VLKNVNISFTVSYRHLVMIIVMNGISYDGFKDEIMDAKEGGEVDVRMRNLHLNHSTE
jgi:hypothetical protein